ncbi:MAG: aspartate dehydrogenase domain-containing protein [Candidatus Omnitrophota bacterium]
MRKKTIGIIGCGTIGSALARFADRELKGKIKDILLMDADPVKSRELMEKLSDARIPDSMARLISDADLIVEAASCEVVPDIILSDECAGKDLMIMSVGGLLKNKGLFARAEEKGVKIIVPSGAVSGIDAIKAAGIAGIENVTITTRKSPKSLKGAPYILETKLDIDNITEETVIFEGNVIDAVNGFPKNINVAAVLSIAGIGPERTKVKIIVSPGYDRNTHEIEVTGKAGRIFTRTENIPSPDNPKTSYLAVLASMASLKGYFSSVRVGT